MNIICGINPVLEALSSGSRHFDRLLVAKGLHNRRVSEAMRLASQHGVALRFETRETLDRMAGDVPHQGLVGVVSAKPVMHLTDLLDQARTPGLMVVLDGVEDPRNLGAILRTVEAAGADGVLLPERHSAGLSETVARASAGGLEHVKVARIGNVVQAIEAMKERGYWVVGFDASGTERWDAVDYCRPVALVLGGEGRGIRRLVREKCDHVASVPLFGHVGSLNVSVAAGIALYEVVRQRKAVPSHVRPIPAAAPARRGPVADEPWPDEEDDLREAKQGLVRLDEHDAPAWSAPTVLHNVSSRPRGRHMRDDRRLHKRGHRPKDERPAQEAGPRDPQEGPREGAPPGAADEGPDRGGRKQRRRKGRKRGPRERDGQMAPAPQNGGAPADESGPRAPREHGRREHAPRDPAPGEQAGGGGSPSEGPGGPQKSRRRRRRRRRPGPGGAPGGGQAGEQGGGGGE